MHDFFRDWRRKAGVVTLLMACAVTGMWIRSRAVRDSVQLPSYRFLPTIVCSWDRFLVVFFPLKPASDGARSFSWTTVKSQPISGLYDHAYTEWRWRFIGFAIGETTERVCIVVVPYWSLAVPLTLLSAYLILWKPRSHRRNRRVAEAHSAQ